MRTLSHFLARNVRHITLFYGLVLTDHAIKLNIPAILAGRRKPRFGGLHNRTVLRIFIIGVFLGVAAAWGVFHEYQPVQIHRESSVLKVIPNGSVQEVFHISLPRDLILAGSPGQVMPEETDWQQTEFLGNLQVNLFKIRNHNDRVVGLASRLASPGDTGGRFTEWMVHLPARGTLYAVMDANRSAEGLRQGHLQAGTREFSSRSGSIIEKFSSMQGEDEPESVIELTFETRVEVASQ